MDKQLIFKYISYIIIFVIGALLGKVYYTISRYIAGDKKNVDRSVKKCFNCKKKFKFSDIIFASFKGKCKYCGKKIDQEMICSEIVVGLTYLAYVMSSNILNVYNQIELNLKFIYLLIFAFIFGYIYVVGLVDKKEKYLYKNIFNAGIIFTLIYLNIMYILRVEVNYVYTLIVIMLVLLLYILNGVVSRENIILNYYTRLLMYLAILSMFIDIRIISFTTIVYAIVGLILYYLNKPVEKKKKDKSKEKSEEKNKSSAKEGIAVYNIGNKKHIPFAYLIPVTAVFLEIMIITLNQFM